MPIFSVENKKTFANLSFAEFYLVVGLILFLYCGFTAQSTHWGHVIPNRTFTGQA